MSRDVDELASAMGEMHDGGPGDVSARRMPAPPKRSSGSTASPDEPAGKIERPQRPTLSAGERSRRRALRRTIEFRRTMIPPLLVMGVAMSVCGAVWFVLPPLHPLRLAGSVWLAFIVLGLGVVAIGLGVGNMLGVRRALA